MTTVAETDRPLQSNSWRWTREQYHRIAESGVFDAKRVELINGEILDMSPMGSRHWLALVWVREALTQVFADGHFLSVQSPLHVSDSSEPEPDIAVIQGRSHDYTGPVPGTAALVVEISDSTLAFDRTAKMSLYASVDIPEYWIVNLMENQVEVYRRPAPHPTATFGHAYLDLSVHRVPETVTPLARPDAALAVAELLP